MSQIADFPPRSPIGCLLKLHIQDVLSIGIDVR
jgi:hypothetical protein